MGGSMITDLLTLEYYFGRIEAAVTLEDVISRYGETRVASAVRAREIELRPSFGRIYVSVSDAVRTRLQDRPSL